ncbi:MAG: hypothetical protein IT167_10090 [Bryobacterales bacterium]|nr:hypothetical protein [Bryobacterales bacterium]
MTRVSGREGGIWLRLIYEMARAVTGKMTGKKEVPEPVKVTAHQGRLLWGVGQMESAQSGMNSVAGKLKALASSASGRGVGCPW